MSEHSPFSELFNIGSFTASFARTASRERNNLRTPMKLLCVVQKRTEYFVIYIFFLLPIAVEQHASYQTSEHRSSVTWELMALPNIFFLIFS